MTALFVVLVILVITVQVATPMWRARRRGRRIHTRPVTTGDQVFAGSAPGVVPAGASTAPTRRAGRGDVAAPVAVRFEPPEGLRPEHVGPLTGAGTATPDLTAAIVDLAVRGDLRLSRRRRPGAAAGLDPGWHVLVPRGAVDGQPEVRRQLLLGLSSEGDQGTYLMYLRPTLRTSVQAGRNHLAHEAAAAGWWTGGRARGGPLLLRGRTRSALGSALAVQLAGFREYLATAEAHQLRTEEGAGIFSRYLPWAIALELTDHWVQVFKEAARTVSDPVVVSAWGDDLGWCDVGIDLGSLDLGGLDLGGLDSLGDSMGDALSDLGDAVSDLADGIGDLADSLGSDVADSGGDGGSGDGGGGGDGGGDGGGGGGD